MMKTTAITELMVKDHLRIAELVQSLDKNMGKSTLEIQNIFRSLSSVLEKHLFIEEKAILTQDEIVDTTELSQIISKLLTEHKKILAMLKEMRKSNNKRRDFDFQSFKEILLNHKDYEEETVYPKLDQELDEDIKEGIIDRIEHLNKSYKSVIMKECTNCGKKLGTFDKYYHQSFEKRWLFCSNCYNEIEKKGSPYKKKLWQELSKDK